jgi:hypothetical protein
MFSPPIFPPHLIAFCFPSPSHLYHGLFVSLRKYQLLFSKEERKAVAEELAGLIKEEPDKSSTGSKCKHQIISQVAACAMPMDSDPIGQYGI